MKKYTIEIQAGDDWTKENIQESLAVYSYKIESIVKNKEKRTPSQNASLHAWIDAIAGECKEKGLTYDVLYKEPTEVPITSLSLKQFAKQTVDVITGGKHDHTSECEKEEFSLLVDTLVKVFGERLDNSLPFPSIEEKLLNERDEL